jgi:hypothetical protein
MDVHMNIFCANLHERPVTTVSDPEPVYLLIQTYILR